MRSFASGTFGELDITECARALKARAATVKAGDLGDAESMLTTQAVALNAIFGELARRAALNMGQHLDATERYMRLAFKAQGQCRTTLETLAAIKNPPVVFARQANISHGPQQVNNGPQPQPSGPAEEAGARVRQLPAPGTDPHPMQGIFPAVGETQNGAAAMVSGEHREPQVAVGSTRAGKSPK